VPRAALRDLAFLAVPLALAWVVWAPLRENYFYHDDFVLLYDAVNQALGRFLIGIQAGHLYVVRNLVALGMLDAFGPDPRPWFAVVVATHLVNVALLFTLVRRLTASARLAALGATLWGIAPVQEGTLGWYSVYGQVLATTLLLVLLLDVDAAARSGAVSGWRVARWIVLALVETNLFGTGIAAALALPVVAWLLLPAGHRRRAGALALLWVAVPALYVTQHWLWATYGGGEAGALETSLRLAAAWWLDLKMFGALVEFGVASVVLGVFEPRPSAAPDAVIVACVCYAVAVGGCAIAASPEARRRALALFLVTVAAYGMIAIGRAVFATIIKGARPVAEEAARYHYLATVPLVTAPLVLAASAASRIRVGMLVRDAVAVAALAGLAVGVARTPWRIDAHDDVRANTVRVLGVIGDAIAAGQPGRFVLIQNRRFAGVGIFVQQRDFPGWAALFAIFHPDDRVDGRTVRFVEPDPLALAAARDGRRTGRLIVGPS